MITKEELKAFLDWRIEYTYETRRQIEPNITPYVVSLVKRNLSEDFKKYEEWNNNFFIEAYFNPQHTETEPFSYQT